MEVMMKELGEIITGNTPSKKTEEFWNSEDICFVKPDIIADNGVNEIVDSNEYISEDARKKARVVGKNSIFVTCIGSIGKIGIASDGECAFNQQINAIIPNDRVQPKYLAYNLLFNKPRLVAIANAPVVPIINKSQFGEFTVNIETDIDRQREIVDVLDKLTQIIQQRNKEISALDDLIKARFVEMFDLNSCKRETLGDCTDFVDYRGHTPELSDDGTIRMVNAKSVGKGFFKYIDEFITEETYDSWMHRGFGYPGDILFVTEGHTFGNTCLIPDDMTKFALGQRVIIIKGHDEIENAFLCSYMQTDMFWKDINVYKTGGTAQGIRSKDLIKVSVPIPPIEKQVEFMNFVHQVDKSKVAVQKALDETQILFDSLMQKYFG